MKFLSAILAAVFCATIVSTEPSSDLPDIDELIDDYYRNANCIQDAMSEALKEADYASEWDEVKANMKKMADDVVAACINKTDFLEFAQCFKEAVDNQNNEENDKLFEKLKHENKELYDRVHENIMEKCFSPE